MSLNWYYVTARVALLKTSKVERFTPHLPTNLPRIIVQFVLLECRCINAALRPPVTFPFTMYIQAG